KMRERMTLATLHRNQGDDSPWRLLLFFAVAGELKVVENIVQPFRRWQGVARPGVQLGHQTLQVLDAVFRSFGIFFRAAQTLKVAGFGQKCLRPELQRKMLFSIESGAGPLDELHEPLKALAGLERT